MVVSLVMVLYVLFGAIAGWFFGLTILDALFFHSEDKGAMVGLLIGVILGLITAMSYLMISKLQVFNKTKKCPKCSSKNTTVLKEISTPLFVSMFCEYTCHDCGNQWLA
jgi:Na+/proline symporter